MSSWHETGGPGGGSDVSTGETDYSTYLHIDELLQLQQPLTDAAHDEMLFIVVHQVYELWFRLVLHELDATVAALAQDRLERALERTRRVVEVFSLMNAQLRLLETMSPEGFLEFRDPLKPASGFQSSQFREIEWLLGAGAAHAPDAPHLTEEQHRLAEQRRHRDPIWSAVLAAAGRAGLDLDGGDDSRLAALAGIYHEHREPTRSHLHQLFEVLIEVDAQLAQWRFHHALMAAREIGSRPGTGGSSGVAYLLGTLDRRAFPDLWEVRSRL